MASIIDNPFSARPDPGSTQFTNGNPFTVTEADLQIRWGGWNPGTHAHGRMFGCRFCEKPFEAGDVARWQYLEGAPNAFVCSGCDRPEIVGLLLDDWHKTKAGMRRWGLE